jgi:hypothetical protein
MAATITNITIEQGATTTIPMVFQRLTNQNLPYDATTNPYTPLVLTDMTISMMVRASYDAKAALLSLSSTGDSPRIVITNAAGGLAEIRLAPADTAYTGSSGVKVVGESLEGVYNIEVSDGTTVVRAFQGTCTISREVVRS